MDQISKTARTLEDHFVFREEMAFTDAAWRHRKLAEWAGGLMGLGGVVLEAYVAEVVGACVRDPRLNAMSKVSADLSARHIAWTPADMPLSGLLPTEARAILAA